jgi:hypothetical protein
VSELRTEYQVPEPNPTGIPRQWLPILQRMARLERGKIYDITLVVPDEPGSKPYWGLTGQAKIEGGD